MAFREWKKQLFSRLEERNAKRTARDAPTHSILTECPSSGVGGDSPSHAHGANPGLQLPHPHCQPALLQKVPTRPASSADWEETTTAYRLTMLWTESYCGIILRNVRKGKLYSERLNITSKVPQLIYDRARL